MYFLTMRKDLAIKLDRVTKKYKLYGSQRDQLLDVLGFHRLGFRLGRPVREFRALDEISLEIPRGHRVGMIGRNGAGKTTLLKLLCGNFTPTSGNVQVNGTVQALMGIGLGFHPDYTGRENVNASLQYNGLAMREQIAAIDEIIDFCELGEFIDQPFKTYSLGMQARLMFAAATAITPDILIIDEVLGAGDAYFVAKSKARVDKLVQSGCTMLLVSHSTQQVLELCDEVVWINDGRIQMKGDALEVIKAYEEFLYGPIQRVRGEAISPEPAKEFAGATGETFTLAQRDVPKSQRDVRPLIARPLPASSRGGRMQEPAYVPHADDIAFPVPEEKAPTLSYEAPGGISRWDSDVGVKLKGLSIITERGEGNTLLSLAPAKITLYVAAELTGEFDCRYGIVLHDMRGQCLTRIFSPRDQFHLQKDQVRSVEIVLNPVQIGPGEYTLGISVLKYDDLENLNSTARYDLLSRSFSIKVALPESLHALEAKYFHTAEWTFG